MRLEEILHAVDHGASPAASVVVIYTLSTIDALCAVNTPVNQVLGLITINTHLYSQNQPWMIKKYNFRVIDGG